MTKTYDNSLENIIKWTRHNMRSYYRHEEYEDAVQEGSLQAWKDMESGEYEPLHIIRRAHLWARAYLQHPDKRPTGAPRLSRDGIGTAKSDAEMWKIYQYRREQYELHGSWPRNEDVAKVFDIPVANVDRQVVRHRDGKWDHAHYIQKNGEKVLHPSYYNPFHIESYAKQRNDDGPSFDTLGDPTPGPEDTVVSNVDFYSLLAKLHPTHQKTLYLMCVEGCNTTQVAEAFGIVKNKNQNGYKRIKNALKAARKVIEAEGLFDVE